MDWKYESTASECPEIGTGNAYNPWVGGYRIQSESVLDVRRTITRSCLRQKHNAP